MVPDDDNDDDVSAANLTNWQLRQPTHDRTNAARARTADSAKVDCLFSRGEYDD